MKKVGAFITIEYSLLLPMLLLLYTFLIYIGLYQYNACLLQTDSYFVLLEGDVTYQNKYLLAEEIKIDYSKTGKKINIVGTGKMHSPLSVMGIGKEYWEFQTDLETQEYSPINVLRVLKGIQDGL